MDINDGMVFEVRFNTIIVHCKIIVSHIISYDVFINGCNLIYLYDVSSRLLNLNDLHTFNNLIGIKIVDLAQCNLETYPSNPPPPLPINKPNAKITLSIQPTPME